MLIAIFSVTLGWPVWLAIVVTFATAAAIGALNGFIVIRTGLPIFIVTLAFLFILRGFTIYLPQTIERKTIIAGIREAAQGADWCGYSAARFSRDCSSGWVTPDSSPRSSVVRGPVSLSWTHSDADHLGNCADRL